MKITQIKTAALFVPYSQPFYWAHGVIDGASVVLVEVHTDAGIVGFGESIAAPSAHAIMACLQSIVPGCIGQDPFANARLIDAASLALSQTVGTGGSPRFTAQVLSGLEMALWDLMGKATGRAVHELLGGAVRDDIRYFGFAQGESAAAVAADAARLASEGFEVIYFKVGRGDALDLATAAAVRAAIGPGTRMRVDPNEHWTPAHASRMIRALTAFDVEIVEQPTSAASISSLAQVRANSPIAIAADQSVCTPFEAYEMCRQQAADLLVVGVHEAGGLARWSKVAHIAEMAGINVCVHGLYETGITTCASNQIAATIVNLDDANQHMQRFLAWDLVKGPDLTPRGGRLPVLGGPGLGFEIDWSGVERARQAWAEREAARVSPARPLSPARP